MKKYILIIITSLITNLNFSQNNLLLEKVILQTNSDFYLAGENLFYKLNCLIESNNQPSSLSKIAYIELINNEKNSVLKQKIKLNNGIAFNDIFIPTNIKSGYYKIIAYTNWMTNFNSFFEKDILIINPYLELPNILKENDDKTLNIPLVNINTSNEKINIGKSKYSKRDKVTFTVKEKIKGNFVLNVNKIDSIPFSNNTKIVDELNKNNKKVISLSNIKNPGEFRGEIYKGKIESKSSEVTVENKKIAFSQIGAEFDFKLSTTNANGEFTIITDKTLSTEGYFQVFDTDRSNYKISLTNINVSDLIDINSFKTSKINRNFGKSILKRSISNQIQNIYYQTKSDTIFAFPNLKPFYRGANKQYILTDYNPQNSLKEVFIEIIPEIYTIKKNGKNYLKVNDYEVNKSDLYENTVVLIDGFLLQDIDEVLTYDPAYFFKIDFINKGYFLNQYIFNGVVNLITKEQNYVPKINEEWIIKTKLEKPELEKKYFNIDYSKNSYTRIPDYRYQLVWEPNITELNPSKEISFYTSDIPGNYKITIEGIDENGNPIVIEDFINVE